ncbi:MAG: RdgB/HAM1 family non-canonical purine NTP pyrophosphatase [Saprospiraceae bacterium]
MSKQPLSLVFATANANKVREVQQILGQYYQFLSLDDIGCREEIPETQPDIPGNALQKAMYIFEHYGRDCFAEDTGLEVASLGGAPGVDTAFYAGSERDAQANMDKLLRELAGHTDRSARFRTVIALVIQGEARLFEGIVNGRIALQQSGEKGFGYDPIFVPEGFDVTFADMTAAQKNSMSHRGRAVAQLKDYLLSIAHEA